MHVKPVLHELLQEPQWVLVVKATHAPLQSVSPAGQV
jgi:hypothetical protein